MRPDQAEDEKLRTPADARDHYQLESHPKYQTTMKSEYKFRKFTDGWWSVIYYLSLGNWGKWRGPFDTKADAEIDCAQASRGKYSL